LGIAIFSAKIPVRCIAVQIYPCHIVATHPGKDQYICTTFFSKNQKCHKNTNTPNPTNIDIQANDFCGFSWVGALVAKVLF
jgi:hypothetical protein